MSLSRSCVIVIEARAEGLVQGKFQYAIFEALKSKSKDP